MGCDIHTIAQRRDETGSWVEVHGDFRNGPDPFDWRSYGMFAFLAGVRNYSGIIPISEPRGLPSDFDLGAYEDGSDGRWFGDHSPSWLSIAELLAVDYEQTIEDRRVARAIAVNVISHAQTCDVGDGVRMPLREFLGEAFFDDLKLLATLHAERIVFAFDN